MSATVKIKGDVQDAQNKIKKLRQEVDRLEREARKPKKVNVQTPSLMSSFSSAFAGSSGAAKTASEYGSLIRMGGKGIGLAASTAVGTFLGSAIGEVVSALKAFAPAILRATTGVTNVGMRLKKFMTVIETYSHPQDESVRRANTIDAIDDERRNHNTNKLSEEAAFTEAWEEVAGASARMMLDRLHSVIGSARSGVWSEMEEAWKLLENFGITNQDLNKSVWEVMAQMLKAYSEAGADGQNELEPFMKRIFGDRNMGVVRKAGDGQEFLQKARTLQQFLESNGFDDPTNMQVASQVETLQGQAKMYDLLFNGEAHQFALEGAQNTLDTARLNHTMLGANATTAFNNLTNEVQGDLTATTGIAQEHPLVQRVLGPLSYLLGDEEETEENSSSVGEILEEGANNIQEFMRSLRATTPRMIEQAPETLLPDNLLEVSRERLDDTHTRINAINTSPFIQPFLPDTNEFIDRVRSNPQYNERKNNTNTETNTNNEQTQQEVIRTMNKLITAIDSNTNTSLLLNSSLSNNALSNTYNNNQSSWV